MGKKIHQYLYVRFCRGFSAEGRRSAETATTPTTTNAYTSTAAAAVDTGLGAERNAG